MSQSEKLAQRRLSGQESGNRPRLRPVALAGRYPLVAATVAVGVVGLLVHASGDARAAAWLVSLYCAGIAAVEAGSVVRQAFRRTWGLDLLAVTAIVSTLLVGDHWASLIIVLMVTGGAALEDFAVQRARAALTALLRQTPQIARRRTDTGSVVEIAVESVAVGDILQIRPGDTVPVDSLLLSDDAAVDESALTGESLPVGKSRGDRLLSGSVNGGTAVDVRAVAVAGDSEFQKIVALVEAASNSKAPFVRMADRFAVPFTVVAYAIAGTAWFVSGDPVRFAEVLVVATPCPLLIAAPVAFIAGMDRAAKSGVIVRSGGAFEQLARVRSAAFDKTGTLTYGRPEVDRVEPVQPFDVAEVLGLASAVESQSGHVLAGAVVAAARTRGLRTLPAAHVEELPGRGVSADVGGRRVKVGKSSFADAGDVPAPLAAGEMAVYVSLDGRPAGRVVLRDETRANAAESVAALRTLGVERLIMLTGDGPQTAALVAAEVGIDEVQASLLPGQKVAAVATASPRPVMMVGDGVNDAPVLAAADVGVAMGARGSSAASETADVVVLVDDLGKVVDVVRIARRTIKVAVQSIWVGIGLSLILMLVASFGLIPAIVGAAAQEAVDVATILNGLRATRSGRSPSSDVPPALPARTSDR